MTREELNKKKVLLSLNNKKYEKVAHSGTEVFLAYRQKVLEGRAKMDALKRQSEMFNVTEANDKHYNDLINTGMLIHAQNPLYGQQRENTKYYKREGEPGKYRYYYTKEEYDAAHRKEDYEKNKAAGEAMKKAEADKQKKEVMTRQQYENNKNSDEMKKLSDVAREGGVSAASSKIIDDGYADDLLDTVKKELRSGKLTYKDGKLKTDDDQLRADIDKKSSSLHKISAEVGKLSGKGNEISNELEKLLISEIEKMDNTNKEMKEKAEKTIADRDAAIKKGYESEQKRQAKEESIKKHIADRKSEINFCEDSTKEFKEKLDEKKKENEEKRKDFINKRDDIVKEFYKANGRDVSIIDAFNETAEKMGINPKPSLYPGLDFSTNNKAIQKEAEEIQKWINKYNERIKEYDHMISTAEDESRKWDYLSEKAYAENLMANYEKQLEDVWAKDNENFYKIFEEVMNNTSINGYKPLNWDEVNYKERERENKKNESAKHSDSDPNTITTSEPLTPEQEYLNFKAKVEAGMKKQETIRHSMFIKSAKKQESRKPIKPIYDNNRFDFYENAKKFKEEHQNSLSHYGTKGQKWGTRHWQNADGTFNEAGKERYFGKSSETKGSSGEVKENSKVKSKEEVEKEFQNSVRTSGADKNPFTDKDTIKKAKKLEKSFYNDKHINHDKIEEWLNSEENQDMVNKYNELFDSIYGEKSNKINDLFKDYDADEDKYVAKAGICDAIMYDDKLSDIGFEISWMLNDDGDQGSRDSRSYYLQEKGHSKKDINNIYNDQEEAYEAARDIANLTTKYNPVIYNMSDNIKTAINNELTYNYNKTHGYAHAKISNASDGMELDKNNISAANDIANKLSPSCGGVKSNGWYYVNQAINNLPDLKDKSYKELTQADWDKINAEINSLKK